MDIAFLGLGYHPKWTLADMPWMPKQRYAIMRDYMPKRGTMGLEMMQATCTVQVNLDFDSESTMVRMFRTALALQPIATALWANSPLKHGKPNGFLSYRSHIWTDTDSDRCGTLPFVFEDGFGFERYVDHALDVPMYFVYRDGAYIDASGQSFRDFMDGKLPALPGELPTIKDWADHLTTLFPEVRLKKFLEMRGADGGPWRRLCALPAFWVGLLYDSDSLDAAWDLVKDWTADEHAMLRRDVPRLALDTPFRSRNVNAIALDALGNRPPRTATPRRNGLYRQQGNGVSRDLVRNCRIRPHPGPAIAGRCKPPAGTATSIRSSANTPTDRFRSASDPRIFAPEID